MASCPGDVRVGEVFRHFEAALPFAECFSAGESSCPLIAACRLRTALEAALAAFYSALDEITLSDLVAGNSGLEAIFSARVAAPVAELCEGRRASPA